MMSPGTLPLVSVIIPTFNRELMVGYAIESALGQTYENIEVIVIDDGSTDGTRELVKKHPRVKYILKENGGQASARNAGLLHAGGTYIASLDSDDIWHPDFLEKCILKLEQDRVDFVFANWLQMVDDDRGYDFFLTTDRFTGHRNCSSFWIDLGQEELRNLYVKDCPSPSSSLVIRRSCIRSGWNEAMKIGDDWCLLLDIVLSPVCSAAFTMDRLWVKRTDANNVYDGINHYKVLEFLNIGDRESMIDLYAPVLTDSELYFLRRELADNIYRLIIHRFIQGKDYTDNLRMFKKIKSVNWYLLVLILYGKFCTAIKKRLPVKNTSPDLKLISLATEISVSLLFPAETA